MHIMDKNNNLFSLKKMKSFNSKCLCGIEHKIDIETIKIGSGVLNEIPLFLRDFKDKRVFIIEDKKTYQAAGKKAEDILKSDFRISKYVFDEEHLIPDEKALGRLLIEIPADTSLLLGVGSGTINDLTRFISYKLHIPYMIIATAPSMDGYASVVAPLIVDGVKTTYNAVYPLAIMADIDVLKVAPMYLIQAGLGDILGKYTALADWRLAHLLKNEYFCESIENLVRTAVQKSEIAIHGLLNREKESIESLTEALILSGLAIGMAGASRPASGEEHHLSHCWEMIFMSSGTGTSFLHGNNVGVGVGIIAEAYHFLKHIDIERVFKSGQYLLFNEEKWLQNLTVVYQKNAGSIYNFKVGSINFEEDQREKEMKNIIANWDKIKEICDLFVPAPRQLREALKKAGAITSPQELGINGSTFKQSLIVAKDLRQRYGVLQLLEDMGMLEETADYLKNLYYS